MLSVSDTNGDLIVKYQIWDGTTDLQSGYFSVEGIKQTHGAVMVDQTQFAQTNLVTGTTGARLEVRAFDGKKRSSGDSESWSLFKIFVC